MTPAFSGVYFTMRDIAQAIGWSTLRTKRWLQRADATFKLNGRWVTTRDLLQASFPEIWDAMAQRVEEG